MRAAEILRDLVIRTTINIEYIAPIVREAININIYGNSERRGWAWAGQDRQVGCRLREGVEDVECRAL